MENKTKQKQHQQVFTYSHYKNNRKIKTALTTNNQWKTKKNRNNTEYLPIAIRKQQKNKKRINN